MYAGLFELDLQHPHVPLLEQCFAVTKVVVPQADEFHGVSQLPHVIEPLRKRLTPATQRFGVMRREVLGVHEPQIRGPPDGFQNCPERREATAGNT